MNTTNSSKTETETETETQQVNVFTYGSLMYADVFQDVTGCLPLAMPARAYHWQRYALKDLTYPGACPAKEQDRFIDGVLWLNVSQSALDALDRFEGDEYRRVLITATAQADKPYPAYIYEWLLPALTQGDWDPAVFDREHRHRFAQIHGARQD